VLYYLAPQKKIGKKLRKNVKKYQLVERKFLI